jgi:hypothetical protein
VGIDEARQYDSPAGVDPVLRPDLVPFGHGGNPAVTHQQGAVRYDADLPQLRPGARPRRTRHGHQLAVVDREFLRHTQTVQHPDP